jgi:hypothetical protein
MDCEKVHLSELSELYSRLSGELRPRADNGKGLEWDVLYSHSRM